jgi:hypothetical protein
MIAVEPSVTDWIALIRAEYEEMPGLVLTCAQIQRMWRIDADLCDRLLRRLVAGGVVERRPDGTYARPNDLTIWRD